MSKPETWLFWGMTILGGLTIAPAVVLPAYFEYRIAASRLQVEQAELDAALAKQDAVERQIQYFHHDPAYVERLWRHELGIRPPDVAAELPAPLPPTPEPDATAAAAPVPPPDHPLQLLRDYPLLRVFVMDETRPVALALGAVLLLTALLLGTPAPRPATSTT